MHLEDAFSRVVDLETRKIATHLTWQSISVWPLLRQCLWLELLDDGNVVGAATNHQADGLVAALSRGCRRVRRYIRAWCSRPPTVGKESIAFISRPVYLQALPDGSLFDRIVDPLISLLPSEVLWRKFYVAPWPEGRHLHAPAYQLRGRPAINQFVIAQHQPFIMQLAEAAGVSAERLCRRYVAALNGFVVWYEAGSKLFRARKNLKTLYLTSWYFPDMMGLIAAAHQQGILTIDVQHGKQGKYQAMYSGWEIPPEGYAMMPDIFWCWGQPSCDHILATSPGRRKHRPLVGGLPWLDYYRQHIAGGSTMASIASAALRVLVTTQPKQGANTEPLPDFLIEFMLSKPQGVHFVFRCHPNDKLGPAYCQRRLLDIPAELYTIDPGEMNLYDRLLEATHHVTAYSSCCYEASAFGVPTLLFGQDAKALYAEEIESGAFAWTEGKLVELEAWLQAGLGNACDAEGGYIISSLSRTSGMLQELSRDAINKS